MARIQQMEFNNLAGQEEATTNTPVAYYKYGGTRKIGKGGVFMGNNVQKYVGPSHEQGGIDIGDGIEVEGQEVKYYNPHTDATTIFSNRIGRGGISYAAIAEHLGKEKSKHEEATNSVDPLVRSTAKRNLGKNRYYTEALVADQISQQIDIGVDPSGERKAEFGLTDMLPYVDNLVNMSLTSNTPEIPRQRQLRYLPTKTELNVNAQLDAISSGVDEAVKSVSQATSSGPTRINTSIAAHLSGAKQKAAILNQKENLETELYNRDIAGRQDILNKNTAGAMQYDMLGFQRANEIQSRISGNFANLAEDAQLQVSEKRLRDRDAAEIALLKERYNRDGIWDRNIDAAFEDYLSHKITYEEFQKRLSAGNTAATTNASSNQTASRIGNRATSPTGQTSANVSRKPTEAQKTAMINKYVLPFISSILPKG